MAPDIAIWHDILDLGRQELACLHSENEEEAVVLSQERVKLLTQAILHAQRSPEIMDLIVEVQRQQKELEQTARKNQEDIAETLRESKKQGQCMAGYYGATQYVSGYNTYLNLKG